MSSKRLPGKVLFPFGQTTVIETIIERVLQARRVSQIVIAISDDPSDDILNEFILDKKIGQVFRGSLPDVFSRYKQLSKDLTEDFILRITGDCPLTCYRLIDQYMEVIDRSKCDFASNTHASGVMKGFNLEFISTKILELQSPNMLTKYDREHVTPIFYRNSQISKIFFEHRESERFKHINLSLDTPEDYKLLNELESRFLISKKTYEEIVIILKDYIK